MWRAEEIKEKARRDWEAAWEESAMYVSEKGSHSMPEQRGKPHPVEEMRQRLREIFLELGFDEVINRTIIPEDEVRAQYGPEAAVILDRCYYLAGLPRPDVGLGKEQLTAIRRIVAGFDAVDELKAILREYKEGQIEADDFIEHMVKRLGINEEQAGRILDEIFARFKSLTPQPTRLTLRAHMTAGWFGTIAALLEKKPLPFHLFSIGPRYRREQREDASHLRVHSSASAVIAAEDVGLADGRAVAEHILVRLGFERIKAVRKRATSRYYARGMEEELFVKYGRKYVEVGDIGMYSPVALAHYGIEVPVFNMGFGLERLAMIKEGLYDVRELVYPQFYRPLSLTDDQLAGMISIARRPHTQIGQLIAKQLVRTAEQHGQKPSPCRFKVFEGEVNNRRMEVWLIEPESGTKLCGPAYLNEIWVYDGNIVALPPLGFEKNKFVQKVRANGMKTGIRFIDAFAALVGAEAEEMAQTYRLVRVRDVKSWADINVSIHPLAVKYVTANRKRISLRGPMFTTAEIKIVD